jgi:hypothetical protein
MPKWLLLVVLAVNAALGACSDSPAARNRQAAAPAAAPDSVVLDTVFVPAFNQTGPQRLLETGTFHHDEVPADAARRRWLGLFRGAKGYYLALAPVRLARVHDVVADADGQQTGWEVSTPGRADRCVLLLPPLRGLAAGPVDSVALAPAELRPGRALTVNFRGQGYTLTARARQLPADTSAVGIRNYKLFLTAAARPGRPQLLAAVPEFDDAMMRLLWAGDLDRDGRPDYLIDTSWHYNATQPTLYLSSPAGPTELVKFVGLHTSVGC